MAKNMQPIAKRCRALGISPAVMGYSKKTSNRNPGGRMRKRANTTCNTEKQKVKFIYGIMEKQFRAKKVEGKQVPLLTFLNADLTTLFSDSDLLPQEEKQDSLSSRSFTVNGKKVNIPSYLVKVGDVIQVSEKSRSTTRFKAIAEGETASTVTPKCLKDENLLGSKVVVLPERDIDYPVEEHLIVELYSK